MFNRKFKFQEQKNNRNGEAYSMFIEEKKGACVNNNNEEKGLAIARAIQKKELSKNNIDNSFFKLDSFSIQSETISGDYFDYIRIDENRTGILVIDIASKGVEAGICVQLIKNTVQETNKNQPIKSFLFELNNSLFSDMPVLKNGILAFYCVLDEEKKSLEYSHCGIAVSRLFSKDKNIQLNNYGGFPLGSIRNEEYTVGKIHLKGGDQLFIATNGLEKIKDVEKNRIGSDWVDKVLTPKKRKKSRLEKISSFINASLSDNALEDDVVCIHAEIKPWSSINSREKKIKIPKHTSISQKVNIIGKSNAFMDIFTTLKRHSELKNDIVLFGERGTGKELWAKLYAGLLDLPIKRVVSCGGFGGQDVNIVHSTFFGHIKGAYSEADDDKKGIVLESDGGCCHIDEFQALSCQEAKIGPLFLDFKDK